MATKFALICHLDEITANYDKVPIGNPTERHFSLNLVAAYEKPDNASTDRAVVEKHLFPWEWQGLNEIKAGYFTGTNFNTIPTKPSVYPSSVGTQNINTGPLKQLAQHEMQVLLDKFGNLEPFCWNSTQVGVNGVAGKEVFRNQMAYFSTLPGGVAHLMHLTWCFSISDADYLLICSGTDNLFYAVPQFTAPFDDSSLTLTASPVASSKADVEQGRPFSWDFNGPGTKGFDATAYSLAFQCTQPPAVPAVPTVPTKPAEPTSLYSKNYFLLKPDEKFFTDGVDWTPLLSRKIADCFDVPQRIVDVVRKNKSDILKWTSTTQKIDEIIYRPMQETLLVTSRDAAHVGLRPGIDGTSVAALILEKCRPPKGNEELDGHAKRHVLAALGRYERDMTRGEWKDVLRSQLGELRGGRVLGDGTKPVVAAPTGMAALDDAIHEWEKFTSAVANDENTAKLLLEQWARAAAKPMRLPRLLDAPPSGVTLDKTKHWFFSMENLDGDDLPESGELNLRERKWKISLRDVFLDLAEGEEQVANLSFAVHLYTSKKDAPITVRLESVSDTKWTLTLETSAGNSATPKFSFPGSGFSLDIILSPPSVIGNDQWKVEVTSNGGNPAPVVIKETTEIFKFAFVVVEAKTPNQSNSGFNYALPIAVPDDLAWALGATPAATFLTRFGSVIGGEIVPGLGLHERLRSCQVKMVWEELLPKTMGALPKFNDGLQLEERATKQAEAFFKGRLEQAAGYRNLRPWLSTVSQGQVTTGELGQMIFAYLDGGIAANVDPTTTQDIIKMNNDTRRRSGFVRRLVHDSILPNLATVSDAPVEVAHPITLQFDRVGRGSSDNDKIDQEDMHRRFAGALVFMRAKGPAKGKWRCLNMASINAAPRRLEPFTSIKPLTLAQINEVLPDFVDEAEALGWLNSPLTVTDHLYLVARELGERLSEETRQLLDIVAKAPAGPLPPVVAEQCQRARWWVLEDHLTGLFRPDQEVHPCAPVPVRFSYRDDLRQSFVSFDNHPLVAQDPSLQLSGAFRPTDEEHTHVEAALKYMMVNGATPGDFASWQKFAPLANGQEYEFLIATVPHSGALPSPVALRNDLNELEHPCAIDNWNDRTVTGVTIFGGNSRLTKFWDDENISHGRNVTYLRRRRIGTPWRSTDKRRPLQPSDKSPTSLMLTPPTDVDPLWEEFPTETLTGSQQQTTFFYDSAQRQGTLSLKPWGDFKTEGEVIWSLVLDEINDTVARAKKGAAVLIEHKFGDVLDLDRRFQLIWKLDKDSSNDVFKFQLLAGKTAKISITSHSITVPAGNGFGYGLRLVMKKQKSTNDFTLIVSYQIGNAAWIECTQGVDLKVTLPSGEALKAFEYGRIRLSFKTEDTEEAAAGALEGEAISFTSPQLQWPGKSLVAPEPDRPLLLLPHPALGRLVAEVNKAIFHVATPVCEITTWDRWVVREAQAAVNQPAPRFDNIHKRRVNTWATVHRGGDAPHAQQNNGTVAGVERSVDDPAVGEFSMDDAVLAKPFLVAELVQLYPLPSVVAAGAKSLIRVDVQQKRGRDIESVQSTPIEVTCLRKVNATPEIKSPATGKLQVTVPAGSLFELRLYPAVDERYFTTDQRFPASLREGRPIFEESITKRYVLMTPLLTAIESATTTMPVPEQVWDAIRFAEDGADGQLIVQLDRAAISTDIEKAYNPENWQWVRRTRLNRQAWQWQGRPLTQFPTALALNADLIPNNNPELETLKASEVPFVWDAEGFGTRSNTEYVEKKRIIERTNPMPPLLEYPLVNDDRALYMRFALDVESRYAGIAELLKLDDPGVQNFPMVSSLRPFKIDPTRKTDPSLDRWRRHFVPGRGSDTRVVTPPAIKFILPLTQGATGGVPGNAGLLVVLSEPWYEKGGLTERLQAQILQKTPANLGPKLQSTGFDPIVSTASQTAWLDEPVVESPIGYTFDTDSKEPLFIGSSFTLHPPCLALKPIKPGGAGGKSWVITLDAAAGDHEIRLNGVELPPLEEGTLSRRWRLVLQAESGVNPPELELVLNQRLTEVLARLDGQTAVTVALPPRDQNLRLDFRLILRAGTGNQWEAAAYCRTFVNEKPQAWQTIHELSHIIYDSSNTPVKTPAVDWVGPALPKVSGLPNCRISLEPLVPLPAPLAAPAGGAPLLSELPDLPQPTIQQNNAWRMAQVRLRRRLTRGNRLTQAASPTKANRKEIADNWEVSEHGVEAGVQLLGCELPISTPIKVEFKARVALDFEIELQPLSGSGAKRILKIGNASYNLKEQPATLDFEVRLRLLATATEGRGVATKLERSWEARVFFRVPGSDWLGGLPVSRTLLETTGTTLNYRLLSNLPEFPARKALCGVTEEERFSVFTDSQWVQFLPDATRVPRRDSGELLDFSTLSLRLAAHKITDPKPKDTAYHFRLRRMLEEAGENNSVGIDTEPRYPMDRSNGRLATTRYLVLTQVVRDVRGRANQEKYVGLYQMDKEGIAHPLSPEPSAGESTPTSESTAAELNRNNVYLVRLMEVQQRLDALPWTCKVHSGMSVSEGLTRTYYTGANLDVARGVADPLFQGKHWEITLSGLHFVAPKLAVGQSAELNFDLIASTPGVCGVRLQIKVDPTPQTQLIIFIGGVPQTPIKMVNQGPIDLRVVIRLLNKKWVARVEARGEIQTNSITTPPGTPWNWVADLGQLDEKLMADMSVTVSLSGTAEKLRANFLPPTLSAEPWDHLFPQEAPGSDGDDAQARIVSLSPPINGADYSLA